MKQWSRRVILNKIFKKNDSCNHDLRFVHHPPHHLLHHKQWNNISRIILLKCAVDSEILTGSTSMRWQNSLNTTRFGSANRQQKHICNRSIKDCAMREEKRNLSWKPTFVLIFQSTNLEGCLEREKTYWNARVF